MLHLHAVCRTCHLEETVLESGEQQVLVAGGPHQEAALVAMVPRTDSEHWSGSQPREIRVFHKGGQI